MLKKKTSLMILPILMLLLFLGISMSHAQGTIDQNATARFEEGLRHIQGEQWEAALETFRPLTERFPDQPDPFYFLGFAQSRLNRFVEAEAAFKAVIQINPNDLRAYLELAQIYEATQALDKALAAYRQVIKIDPKGTAAKASQHQILKIEGLISAREGNYEEAIERFVKAIEIDSEDAFLQFNLGLLYLRVNREDEAEHAFQNALRLNPAHQSALSNLGDLYRKQRDFRKAVATYRRVVEIDATSEVGRRARGNLSLLEATLLAQEGKIDEALAMFEAALPFSEEKDAIYFNMGSIYFSRQEIEKAEDAFQKALRENPRHQRAHRRLGNALELLGRMEEAQAAYEKASDLAQDPASEIDAQLLALTAKGRIASRDGKLDEAEAAFKKTTELQADNGSNFFNLGFIYFRNNKKDLAARAFERAIALSPKESDAYMALATLHEEEDRLEEAMSLYEKVVTIEQRPYVVQAKGRLLYLKGLALARKGDEVAALRAFEEAIEANPQELSAYFASGRIHEQADRKEAAIALYKKLTALEGNAFQSRAQARIHLLNGRARVKEQDIEAAQNEFEAAIEANPEEISAYRFLAEVQSTQGFLEDAIATLKKGISRDPNDISLNLNLALLYVDIERPSQAAQTFRALLPLLSEAEDADLAEDIRNQLDTLFGTLFLSQEIFYDSNITFSAQEIDDFTSDTALNFHRFIDLGEGWRSGLRLAPKMRVFHRSQEAFFSEGTDIYLAKLDYQQGLTLNYTFDFSLLDGSLSGRSHTLALEGYRPTPSGRSIDAGLRLRYSEAISDPAFNGYQPSLSLGLSKIPFWRGKLRVMGLLFSNFNTEEIGEDNAYAGLSTGFNYSDLLPLGLQWNFGYNVSLQHFLNRDSVFNKHRFNQFHSVNAGLNKNVQGGLQFFMNLSWMLNTSNLGGTAPGIEEALVAEQNSALSDFNRWSSSLGARLLF